MQRARIGPPEEPQIEEDFQIEIGPVVKEVKQPYPFPPGPVMYEKVKGAEIYAKRTGDGRAKALDAA